MKRILAAALLLGTVISAHADTDVYRNATKQKRVDDALHADTYSCGGKFGMPQNGT